MVLTNRFKPQSAKNIMGNKEAVTKLKYCIVNSKPALIYGPPGIGKSSSIYALAKDLKFAVYEKNASDKRKKDDLKDMLRQVKNKPFQPTIFVLEEIDGAKSSRESEDESSDIDYNILTQIVKFSKSPLVLTCNDYYNKAIPKSLKNICSVIEFKKPRISDVKNLIQRIEKESGLKANYSNISSDIRNSILCAFYGGEKIETSNDFEIISRYFKDGDITELNFDQHSTWLMDNACNILNGKKLYDFYQLLALAESTNRISPLKVCWYAKGRIMFPRYLQRRKMFRKKI